MTVDELNELRQKQHNLENEVIDLKRTLKSYYETIPFAIVGNLLIQILEQIIKERNYLNHKFDVDKMSEISEKIIDDLVVIPKPKDLQIGYKIQDFYKETFQNLISKYLIEPSEKKVESIEILHGYSEFEKSNFHRFVQDIKSAFKEKIGYDKY